MSYTKILPLTRISRWKWFTAIHFALDLLAIAMAWRLTILARVRLNPWARLHMTPESFKQVIPDPILIMVLWTLVSLWLGTYRKRPVLSAVQAFGQAIESDIIACALAVIVTFFSLGASDIARSFILLFGPISLPLLAFSFYLSVFITMTVERHCTEPRRVAIVGEGEDARSVVETIQKSPMQSLTFAGLIVPEVPLAAAETSALPVLGTMNQLAELINRERIDQLICVSQRPEQFALCSTVSHRMGVTISRPVLSHWENVRFRFNNENGLDLIDAEPVVVTPVQQFAKRAVDVLLSTLLLLFLSPLLITLAILIRLTSRGPVFYKSPRVGRGGRYFIFWKFRSMYTAGPTRKELLARNETNGHLFKLKRDPRITPLGRFMRRYSLDELPQLINVLKGEMSLVGPRPLPAEDLDPDGLSQLHAAWAQQRTQVVPGITGIWQIRGRSDLSFEQMVEFDMDYIRNWSLGLDFQILVETPLAVLSGRGAY